MTTVRTSLDTSQSPYLADSTACADSTQRELIVFRRTAVAEHATGRTEIVTDL